MDPISLLSLAAGAKSLFSKKAKQPAYQQQAFNGQYQQADESQLPNANVPEYGFDSQEQETGNALFQTVVGRQLANYNAGRPILDEPYRNAVLGQAKRSFDLSAGESGNQVNEQYNRLNLLGATGHGQALGEVQRSRLHGLQDIEDSLVQQELGQLNNATNQGMQLQNAFAQRANNKFNANLAGAQFGFGAGMQRANFGQQERQNAFSNALAGYGANQRERQTAFQGQQSQAENEQNKGLGLLQIGAGLYGRGTGGGAGRGASVVSGMRQARSGVRGLGGVGGMR